MGTYREEIEELATKRADAWVAYQRARQAEMDAFNDVVIANLSDDPAILEDVRHYKAQYAATKDARVLALREEVMTALHEVERLNSLSPWGAD